jgi:xylan 1,4-beta-xylosidase
MNLLPSKATFTTLWSLLIIHFGAAQSITIQNPILTGFYPDPSIVKVGADYYSVHSTFSYFPGLPIMHSRDLKNWKQIGNAIDRPSQMDFMGERMSRGLFAPAISYYKGLYYLTCTDIDHEGNFVITAKHPAGPWSDPIKMPEVRGIDPSIYFDESTDKAYVIFNSDPPENKALYSGHRTVRMYEFDYKNLKPIGEQKILINGGVDISKKPVWIEGPHILKKDEWYILYCAEGGTSVNHSQVALRSKEVWGPYIPYEKNPILTQRDLPADRLHPVTSAGHAQIIEGPDGKDYSIFLAVRPYEGDYYNTGRETFLAPVEWRDGWPVINPYHKEVQYSQTFGFKEVKIKGAVPQNGNFSYTTKFDKGLDYSMMHLRTIDPSSFNTSKKDGLTLKLKAETILERGNPSFVAKRQQHMYSTAETELKFTPKSENEKAGLVIYQDESHFYFLAKSIKNGKTQVELYKSVHRKPEVELINSLPVGEGKIKLRISSRADKCDFEISENGKNYTLLAKDLDGKHLSTKVSGGFIGNVYAMYATANGQKSDNVASFKYLKYSGNDPMLK